MRLLMFWPDRQSACMIRDEMEARDWDVEVCFDGRKLENGDAACDVLLMHLCLPFRDGLRAGNAFALSRPVCPPRILFAAPPEWQTARPFWADKMVDPCLSPHRLCTLVELIAKKPLPVLAAAEREDIAQAIEEFLDALAMKKRMKGRAYAAWLLARMIPSPSDLPLGPMYAECARVFGTTPAAVERCLRVCVESVFTQGSIAGIERYFGATVDPERGKPTNRAFLMQAVWKLRMQLNHSRATARSLNKSEMHHRPAAPTSV